MRDYGQDKLIEDSDSTSGENADNYGITSRLSLVQVKRKRNDHRKYRSTVTTQVYETDRTSE